MRRMEWPARASTGTALGSVLLIAACGVEEGRPLQVAEALPLPPPAPATLAVGPSGGYWLGEPGRLRVVEGTRTRAVLPFAGEDPPRVLGWSDSAAYLTAGDSLLVVPERLDSVRARRELRGGIPLAIDRRGRFIFQGARSGAVLAHDPATLEPVWAWPALGSPTTALALSPEGDRIYHALGSEEGGNRVLIRDLQTGRELASISISSPLHQLLADPSGTLYGVAREGRRAVVVALEPSRNQLRLAWRRNLQMAEVTADVQMAVADGRVAVWGLGAGLRLLDAASGAVLGRTGSDPLDVSFGAGGRLWALYPGELRRLE